MLKIQPSYLKLTELLDGCLFRIPEYQRAYSWTQRERGDLFNDILKTQARGEDATHFMATVVGLRHKRPLVLGTDEFFSVDVVDGQQRLTTLIILLKSVAEALDESDGQQRKVAVQLNELLVKPEGDELLLLQTNHDTSHYFRDFLRGTRTPDASKAETLADRELLAAVAECRAFVEQWRSEGTPLIDLVSLLKNRLFFLLHQIEDEKTVYTVFEVLNSRGLAVSWLDRLKSLLMGAAFELPSGNSQRVVDDLHTIWRDIYSVIGLRQGMSAQALRIAATLRKGEAASRLLGEQDAVNVLRAEATDASSIRKVAEHLLRVTKAYDSVLQNRRLEAVTAIAQARHVLTALELADHLSPKEKDWLRRLWESISFRIYGLYRKDARTGVGDYNRLAWQIVNDALDATEIGRKLKEIGHQYPASGIAEAMRGENCYEGWENQLRYFLSRYEEHLAAKSGQKFSNEQWDRIWTASAADSIEHVLPQSHWSSTVHRLGNLLMLPPKLNSQLQARRPERKRDAYRKSGLLVAVEVANLLDNGGEEWGRSAIEQREKVLLAWASDEWEDPA